LNFLAGMLFGLDQWAIEDELFELACFKQICQEKGIPFFVLGPTPVTNSFLRNKIWEKMNAVLKARLPGMNIPFCSVEGITSISGLDLQLGDGIHLNIAGHEYVAKQLHPFLAPWMKSILGLVSPGSAI